MEIEKIFKIIALVLIQVFIVSYCAGDVYLTGGARSVEILRKSGDSLAPASCIGLKDFQIFFSRVIDQQISGKAGLRFFQNIAANSELWDLAQEGNLTARKIRSKTGLSINLIRKYLKVFVESGYLKRESRSPQLHRYGFTGKGHQILNQIKRNQDMLFPLSIEISSIDADKDSQMMDEFLANNLVTKENIDRAWKELLQNNKRKKENKVVGGFKIVSFDKAGKARIEGVIFYRFDSEDRPYLFITAFEIHPDNRGPTKKLVNISDKLLEQAVKKSIELGFEGRIFFHCSAGNCPSGMTKQGERFAQRVGMTYHLYGYGFYKREDATAFLERADMVSVGLRQGGYVFARAVVEKMFPVELLPAIREIQDIIKKDKLKKSFWMSGSGKILKNIGEKDLNNSGLIYQITEDRIFSLKVNKNKKEEVSVLSRVDRGQAMLFIRKINPHIITLWTALDDLEESHFSWSKSEKNRQTIIENYRLIKNELDRLGEKIRVKGINIIEPLNEIYTAAVSSAGKGGINTMRAALGRFEKELGMFCGVSDNLSGLGNIVLMQTDDLLKNTPVVTLVEQAI